MSVPQDTTPQKLKAFFEKRLVTTLLCFVVGSLAALSMPPLNLWPVLFIGLPALYIAVANAPGILTGFIRGWLFGFGYFLFSLSWIGNALLVEGNHFKWAWPLAVSGLPALLAFFPALSCAISKKLFNFRSFWGLLGFISILCGFEWLRGHIFTGFPWNLFGYTWADHLAILQILRLSDVYMLTWLTCLWAMVPAAWLLLHSKKEKLSFVSFAMLSIMGCIGFGVWQLQTPLRFKDDTAIKIVQPNIPQAEKWKKDKMAAHFETQIALSENNDRNRTRTLIIWPETALSFRILDQVDSMPEIQRMLSTYPGKAILLSGALLRDLEAKTYTNSLIAVQDDGSVINVYDKHHLVPFGEYIPFQKWIPLTPVVRFKGFEFGDGLKTHELPGGLKYSPLICYEIIFPGRSTAEDSNPDFIINVTNDGWYGDSAGPHQHFTMAQYRAIETGVPVIRVANTGISGVISPQGQVFGQTALFEAAAHVVNIPEKMPIRGYLQEIKHIVFPVFLLLCAIFGIRKRLSLQM